MTRTLWCLDGATDATLIQPLRLDQGLRLHLQHTELTTVLMQIGEQQQSYVAIQGCEGCAHGRCTPGCYVELLRRLLRVCFDAGTLRAVTGGLAKRPYRRVALAWPTAKAEPLARISLMSWPEARLIVQWRGTPRQISSAALLAVGADGPDPASALRVIGWQSWALPRALGPKLANSASPPPLPFARAWPHAPALLWPQPAAPGRHGRPQDAQSEDSLPGTLIAPVGATQEG
jgi:hypothetical protein